MFYRLNDADFAVLEGAWTDTSLQCDKGGTGGINKQDGRAYQLSIRDKKMTMSGTMIQYFDYPVCTLNTASSAHEWACQMYLPAKAKQTHGYPRFDAPGVIQGYYFSSYIPSVYDVSLVAGVLAVMF
jgi:formylmethanofuran dehydrogenase subunit E-like metal-binding protein